MPFWAFDDCQVAGGGDFVDPDIPALSRGMRDAGLSALFARQRGVISSAQLDTVGYSTKRRRARLASGEWTTAAPGVFVLASSPDTWYQRATIATVCRDGPLMLSHEAAARLHGFDGFERCTTIHVVARRSQSPRVPSWVTLHRLRTLDRADVTTVQGLPVTTIAATLVHIAGLGDTDRTAQALDGVLRSGVSPRWIRETGDRLSGRGVRGPTLLRALLDDRVGKRLPRSWFQRLAKSILETSGLKLLDEYPVLDPSTGRLLAELDLANPELAVGVECQSWRHHGSPSAQRKDLTRKRRLRALGWEIVDVWWSDLKRPDEVIEDLLAVINRQRKMRTGS